MKAIYLYNYLPTNQPKGLKKRPKASCSQCTCLSVDQLRFYGMFHVFRGAIIYGQLKVETYDTVYCPELGRQCSGPECS